MADTWLNLASATWYPIVFVFLSQYFLRQVLHDPSATEAEHVTRHRRYLAAERCRQKERDHTGLTLAKLLDPLFPSFYVLHFVGFYLIDFFICVRLFLFYPAHVNISRASGRPSTSSTEAWSAGGRMAGSQGRPRTGSPTTRSLHGLYALLVVLLCTSLQVSLRRFRG